jgi:hypothetical protein
VAYNMEEGSSAMMWALTSSLADQQSRMRAV